MVTVTYRTIQRNGSDTPTGLNIEPKMCEH
jgi:hypothetical protein